MCSIFSSAGKFCLAYGPRQLTQNTKNDVSCLQTFFTRHNENEKRRHKELIRFHSIIGKKNNLSSISDADQEIPTLGSTDNAGNSVNLVAGIVSLPSGWDFSVCIRDR